MAHEVERSLRKRVTRQEVKLWVHLRSWRKQGFHFRRQAPLDGNLDGVLTLINEALRNPPPGLAAG